MLTRRGNYTVIFTATRKDPFAPEIEFTGEPVVKKLQVGTPSTWGTNAWVLK
jgi:hypothetical protein